MHREEQEIKESQGVATILPTSWVHDGTCVFLPSVCGPVEKHFSDFALPGQGLAYSPLNSDGEDLWYLTITGTGMDRPNIYE